MARKRNIRVKGIRRREPDVRKLGRALLALVEAQREADAAAIHHDLPEHPDKDQRSDAR